MVEGKAALPTWTAPQEGKVQRPYLEVSWEDPSYDALQLRIQGDSQLVVNWINGEAAIRDKKHVQNTHAARRALANLWAQLDTSPAPSQGNWVMH